MDMNAGYAEQVRARCPQAEIFYDLFHVVAKYGREVIDRVRVDCARIVRRVACRSARAGCCYAIERTWHTPPTACG
jgi:transposase